MKKFFRISFILLSFIAFGQNKISGTVFDSDGLVLPGANVIIKNTNTGVSTDFDGNFEIEADKDQVLQFSYTGFMTLEVIVGNQDSISISLQPSNQLDEVVVTSLGFTEKRDRQGSTYSVVSTGAVQRSGEATFVNSLSGKAAGVSISRTSGDPGAGSRIRIRGANTILGSSSPQHVSHPCLSFHLKY